MKPPIIFYHKRINIVTHLNSKPSPSNPHLECLQICDLELVSNDKPRLIVKYALITHVRKQMVNLKSLQVSLSSKQWVDITNRFSSTHYLREVAVKRETWPSTP
jgi:hypothetical protein